MEQQPSRYVQPDVSEARVARLWGNVAERLGQRRPARRYGVALGALGAVAAAAAIWVAVGRGQAELPPSAFEQATFETRSDTSQVALKDGSQIELASETRVEVVESEKHSMRLSLRRGRVTCDVAKNEQRSFVVVAGNVQVRVVGTKFTVSTTDMQHGQRVEVNVERGVVEVKGARGGPVRLSAGQTFREDPEPPAGLVPPPLPPPQVTPPTTSAAPPPAPSASAASAKDLLDQANWARRMGQNREAAAAYEALLKRFPSDGRAGLAAFELGRLRMDALKDLAGAAQALERAVALAPGSAFREDALARLTLAYAGLGRTADCAKAKSRYLKSYPDGVHKDAVSARCN